MAETSKSKTEKIKHPQNYYETPDALTKDPDLSCEEKKKAFSSPLSAYEVTAMIGTHWTRNNERRREQLGR